MHQVAVRELTNGPICKFDTGNAGIWIGCNYGNSDNIIVGKRLDDTVSECTATYSKDKRSVFSANIRCKFNR